MNYYQFHIGDFRSGTVNMSRVSRWIYRDMLDVYYDTEAPLPLDFDALCDVLGVEEDTERKIVERLLRFKFERLEDGYHHPVCDRVLLDYRGRAERARTNGKRGGRPPKAVETDKQPTDNPLGFHSVPTSNPSESESKTKPITIKKNKENTLSGKPDESCRRPVDAQAESIIDYLNLKAGSRYKPVEANLRLIRARLSESASVDEMHAVIDMKAKEWLGTEQEKYLRPETLFNATKYSQYAGQIGGLAKVAYSREVVL